MVREIIKQKMAHQPGHVHRNPSDLHEILRALALLGIEDHEQPREFFTHFTFSGVLSNKPIELLDLCSPTHQIFEATHFGRDAYGISTDFICLTSGEGEGFVLYCSHDRKVYDLGVDELDALERGEIQPNWESFFDLVEWYLS